MRGPGIILIACGALVGCGGLTDPPTAGGTESPIVLPSTIVPPVLSAAVARQAAATSAPLPATVPVAVDTPLLVMVANDDGIAAPGLDALAAGLARRAATDVVVVAPADDRSADADAVSPGEIPATPSATASGVAATVIAGTAADTVVWAIEQNHLPRRPDLVVVGINNGAELSGDVLRGSGAVGVARRSAAAGVPALAVSFTTGAGDYAPAVDAVLRWIDEHQDEILSVETGVSMFTVMAVPDCPTAGLVTRGVIDAPPGILGDRDLLAPIDCASAATPLDDVSAYQNGYIAVSRIAL